MFLGAPNARDMLSYNCSLNAFGSQVLDISANLAEQLPSGVLELTRLRELYAGMNRLGVHMHTFSRLEQLEVLVLASNKLLAVHPSLWGLTTLKRLDLGHNSLSELPADISRLTGLTVSIEGRQLPCIIACMQLVL